MLNAVRPVEKNETETPAEVPADTTAAAQPAADQNAASQNNGEQATSPAEATANVQEPAGTTPVQNAEAPAKEEAAKENTEVKR